MKDPNVSIIVPCYNQAQYLDEALQSVLNQTYENWECIIVNDGSLDNTEKLAVNWTKKDSRFVYLKKKNEGLCAARNSGIGAARGEFILPLDADDKISVNYVEFAYKSFVEDDSIKVVYCKAEKFGDEYGLWNLPSFSLYNLSLNNLIFPCAMFKKSSWKTVGGYDINMKYGWEDWELWISLLKDGSNVKCLDIVGFHYRVKSFSMLKSIDYEKGKYLLEYLSVKHADFFVKQLGSFNHLNQLILTTKREYETKLRSEKFVIDVFCKRFFGFTIFGKYKNGL